MDRQALSETSTELKRTYSLDDGRYGQIEQGFSYAFALGSIVFGWLADRFGPRRLYPIILAGWSLAGVAVTFAASETVIAWLEGPSDEPGTGTFRWLLICRTVLGLFEAGHWPCALITARQILTASERPFGNALLQSGASLGAVLTPLYVLLVRSFGGSWQVVFWTIGLTGLLWIPLWFFLVRRGDLDGPPPVPADGETPLSWSVFIRRLVVLLVIVSVLGVSWQFIRAWLPKFLKEYHLYTDRESAWVVAGYYIAADIGCIICGFSVKVLAGRGLRVHSGRLAVFAIWAGLTALATTIPFIGPNPWLLAPVLMLVGAGILGLHPVYYALAQELPARRMGLISGCLAAASWVTVGTVQRMVGDHINATGSYTEGFMVAGLAPLLGLFVLVVLWSPGENPEPEARPEKKPKPETETDGL